MPEKERALSSPRKDDHVHLATLQGSSRHVPNDFDLVRFVHHPLGAVDVNDISTEAEFCGMATPVPLYINAMTGGSAATLTINGQLARVAAETGVAIAAGSMSAVLRDPKTAPSFRILRDENPDGIILANLSANATPEQAAEVVDLLAADALQVHVNSVQEIVMPEGDRVFAHWLEHIRKIIQTSSVPVIVKEVGFGFSAETLDQLVAIGVHYVDVSGRGGTNFADIENSRRTQQDFTQLLSWGQSTVESLLESQDAMAQNRLKIYASGGVRTAADLVKALAFGAEAVGVAGGFLHTLRTKGEGALTGEIERWLFQMRSIMAILGASTVADLARTDLLVTGAAREYGLNRGIDVARLAQRSRQVVPRKSESKRRGMQ